MFLDSELVARRYFFPRGEAPARPHWVEGPGGRLACAYVAVDESAPTLIHFHGNGEVVADYVDDDGDHAFASLGVNVLYAEYRGYGASEGEPSFVSMLDDVDAIFDSVGADPSRTFAFGRSVGSIYAIELIRRRPAIRGLIIESGIADPLERVLLRVRPEELGTDLATLAAEASAVLDHRKKLAAYRGKLLVLHARGDDLVDMSHAERNHASGGGDDKRLVLFDRGDHNSIMAYNRAAYLRAVADFIA